MSTLYHDDDEEVECLIRLLRSQDLRLARDDTVGDMLGYVNLSIRTDKKIVKAFNRTSLPYRINHVIYSRFLDKIDSDEVYLFKE